MNLNAADRALAKQFAGPDAEPKAEGNAHVHPAFATALKSIAPAPKYDHAPALLEALEKALEMIQQNAKEAFEDLRSPYCFRIQWAEEDPDAFGTWDHLRRTAQYARQCGVGK